ncbi:hypothetical protein B0H13DRAFT_2307816 [Mycena leptocephala]|nr:hypothetical protein B0H13DRAFT_2307816 [Mycena leptocephala]
MTQTPSEHKWRDEDYLTLLPTILSLVHCFITISLSAYLDVFNYRSAVEYHPESVAGRPSDATASSLHHPPVAGTAGEVYATSHGGVVHQARRARSPLDPSPTPRDAGHRFQHYSSPQPLSRGGTGKLKKLQHVMELAKNDDFASFAPDREVEKGADGGLAGVDNGSNPCVWQLRHVTELARNDDSASLVPDEPIHAVPKPNSEKLRLVVNHKFGDFSLNSMIPRAAIVGSPIDTLKNLGDRILSLRRIHGPDTQLVIVTIDGQRHVDRCNNFGNHGAARSFMGLVAWIAINRGVESNVYIDDTISVELVDDIDFYEPYKPALSHVYEKMEGKTNANAGISLSTGVINDLAWFSRHVTNSTGVHLLEAVDWEPADTEQTGFPWKARQILSTFLYKW